jgi:Ca2+-transporting ATPase
MAAVTLAVQAAGVAAGAPWQTMTFLLLALLQLGNALAVRSEHVSAFSLGLASNRPLAVVIVLTALAQIAMAYIPLTAAIFDLQPLGAAELVLVLAVSPTAFIAVEIGKWAGRHRTRRLGGEAGRGVPAS